MSEIQKCPECECDIAQHNSERFYALHYNPVGSKEKCYCSRTYESLVDDGTPETEESPSLQLLIIDLGDSCIVKVEKGLFDASNLVFPSDNWTVAEAHLYAAPFTELREVIDGEKPVPRIEPPTALGLYQLITDGVNRDGIYLSHEVIDAISELTGKFLPIWKGGEWTRLPSTSEYMGDPLESIGIAIWRYTR